MTPTEFKMLWTTGSDPFMEQKLITFPRDVVATVRISQDDQDFLVNVGLPDSAAPFLDFGSKHALLMPAAGSLFRNFRVIGLNGSGDAVCIDETGRGRVVYLNHDDHMSVNFINSSIPQLAYSLLAFRDVVKESRSMRGEDAYLDGNVPLEVADRFIGKMGEIDPQAIEPNSFWLGNVVPQAM